MPPTPILAISDGTTRISLHNDIGLYLRDWRPGRPGDKKVRREPAFGGGAQVVMNEYGNVIDTFEVGLRGYCQDHIIEDLQDADRLLQKAVNYWASTWTTEPVWLEARGSEETGIRYATIKDYSVDGMANPYAQPFFTGLGAGNMNELTIAIEHDIWQANQPGTATCVELYHSKSVTAPAEEVCIPTAGTDDAWCDKSGAGAIDIAGNNLIMGADATPDAQEVGVRFIDVDVPNGVTGPVTVLNAYIEFMANANSNNDTCNLRIYGELDAAPATFSTYANFYARGRTTAYANWSALPHWVNGTYYRSPNLAAVVQEIINLGGWASGNNMVLFVQNNSSTASAVRQAESLDGSTATVLHITYSSGSIYAGVRSVNATCLDVPHVTNHHNWEVSTNAEGITHAYTYDASTFTYSANLLTGALPTNLLPNPVQNGDMLYVGAVDTAVGALDDRNVFHNIIFNVGTAATYGAGDSSAWEYWNGAAWATLQVYDDTSSGTAMDEAFGVGGIRGVHWAFPSNWAATIINGVNAYWVRCVITVAAAVTVPTQQVDDIFTCRWAAVDIAADQVMGTLPALARWRVHPRSDRKADNWIDGMYSCLYMGLRTHSRDGIYADIFSGYWPVASDQKPYGSSQLYYSPAGTTTAEELDYRSPYGGLAAHWATGAAASAMANIIRIRQYDLASDDISRMNGTYHMFVRYRLAAGTAGDVILGAHTGIATATTAKRIIALPTNAIEVADFGRIQIGPAFGRPPKESNEIDIYLQAEQTVAAARNLWVYDIILIPADEWYAKVVVDTETGELIDIDEQLDIDSVDTPKNKRLCVVRDIDLTGTRYVIYWNWTRQGAGPNILQANTWQRIWFFAREHATPGTPGVSAPSGNLEGPFHLCASVRCEGTARYMAMRGSR
jgi:hypothetical protein